MLGIDVRNSRELQALILSIRQADKAAQAEIRKHTKPVVQKAWQQGLAQHAETPLEHRVLVQTARVAVSNQNVKLKAGGLAKKLSGGARAFEIAPQTEFGAKVRKISYTGRRGGKTFPVTRRTGAQFRTPQKGGRVVYQTAADLIPRLAALWTQTAVRTLHEAFERKL